MTAITKGNLGKDQYTKRTEQATADHHEQRDRGSQQEGAQYDPARPSRTLAVQKVDEDQSTQFTGQEKNR
jgi:hypothetical protein